MTDTSDRLALFLVVESALCSAGLRRHFFEAASKASAMVEPSPLPPPGCWPTLAPDEIALGFAMATNVIRNAGFPAEAAQLSVLSGTHGHA